MKRSAAILMSLGWTAVFGLVAAFALFAAEDGAARAIALFALPIDGRAVETLPGRAVMGGLCFGATAVAALFATAALANALSGRDNRSYARLIVEMAHGGGFGIAGLIVLTVALAASGTVLAASLAALAAMVASLLFQRHALADIVPAPAAAPVVARQMAMAAAANVNVVRFPYYNRAGGAA